jgi:hypothetical protein
VASFGGVTNALQVSGSDPVGTTYSLNLTDPSIANGAAIAFSVSSRNEFYQGRTTWNQSQGSGVPAGAPTTTGVAPVATPDTKAGTSATLTWSSVFGDNGKSISDYYAAVFQGGNPTRCDVSGVAQGQPSLSTNGLQRVQGGSTTFSGLSPNQSYNFIVYAYNGQGCTPAAIVSATPRQAPGDVTGIAVGPRERNAYTADFPVTISYQAGGGSNPTFDYQLLNGATVVDSGTLTGTSGVLTGSGADHYGVPLTVRITRVCEGYPGGSTLCNTQDASQSLGVAVSLTIGGARYDAASHVFSWTSWPTGAYDAVTYSCDGTTQLPMPAVGQTASCTAPANDPAPTLTVRVVVGSDTYAQDYPGSGLQ